MFQTSRKQDLPKLIPGCYDSFTSELRPMTDEERQRTMDFIVESLAGLTVNDQRQDARLDKIIQSHEKAIHRMKRDEDILKMMIRAGRRERKTRSEADELLRIAQAELTRSIAHTDAKLDALVDIVRQRLNGS
jgi:hypothetical protein